MTSLLDHRLITNYIILNYIILDYIILDYLMLMTNLQKLSSGLEWSNRAGRVNLNILWP